jgi:hypothetical protein
VNRIITRPQLKQGQGTAVDADTVGGAITVTTNGGNITIENEDFAKAVVTAGRSVSTITVNDNTTAITGVITKGTDDKYHIDASKLSASTTYKLTIVTANFVKEDTGQTPLYVSLNSVVYYIKLN